MRTRLLPSSDAPRTPSRARALAAMSWLANAAAKAEAAQSYDQLSRKEALAGCTSRLKPSDIDLLRARYSEDESVAQIAARMGRTRDAVYKVLARIHRDLRLCIKGKLDQIGDPV